MRTPLPFFLPAVGAAFAVVAATGKISLVVQPLVDGDVLEPSLLNEVDHALSRAPVPPAERSGDAPAALEALKAGLLGTTNRLDATAIATRLVSAQRSDGRWLVGTNDVTAIAVGILREVAGDGRAPDR